MIYDLPLYDWISIGLNKRSLASAVNAIEKGISLTDVIKCNDGNRRYMEKILREEVVKQFSDRRRPMLEVILNCIDARPGDSQNYSIDVKTGRKFKASDTGLGMSIEQILRLLIIPFNTDKQGIEEIGRFGVGFLSTFNYCVLNPSGTEITVDTQKEKQRHRIQFYCNENNVGSLRMRIKKKSPRKSDGTIVKITGSAIRFPNEFRTYVEDYLRKDLGAMPSFMARIYVNGEMINNDRNISWYSAPVKLKALGREVTQRIGLCIESKDNKMASNLINLSSQGVRVKTLSSQYGGANISFPGAVQVVEGRDEFKIDDNYKTSVNAVFSALEEYIRAENKENKITEHATNLIASLASAFALTTLKDLPNLNNLKELLLKDKRYVLTPVQFEDLSPFLGPTLDRLAFKASDTSTTYWSQIYGRNVDIISDIMKPVSSSDPFNFAFGISSKYPNLSLVAGEILKELKIKSSRDFYDKDRKDAVKFYEKVHTVKVPEPGNEAFYLNAESNELYVNVAHPFIAGKREPNKLYATLFDYYNNPKIIQRHDLNNWRVEKDVRALALKLVEVDSKTVKEKAPTYEYTPKIKLPEAPNATNT